MTLFNSWLEETRRLQEEAYGQDYARFSTNSGDLRRCRALVDYIDEMSFAAVHEVTELHDEVSWKSWQSDGPYVHRELVVKEAVDALHFLANILCAVGCSDEELDNVYLGKMGVNRARQARAGGYRVTDAGVKCRDCGRALDDTPPSVADPSVCERCYVTA